MNSKILIGAILSVVVILALVVLMGNGDKGNQTSPTDPNQVTNQDQLPQTVTITVDESGFSPNIININAGTRVNFVNESGGDISINSDNHPTHELYPDLNIGLIPDGLNAHLVFEQTGTYTYHDHLDPTRTGTVVVE